VGAKISENQSSLFHQCHGKSVAERLRGGGRMIKKQKKTVMLDTIPFYFCTFALYEKMNTGTTTVAAPTATCALRDSVAPMPHPVVFYGY